MIRNKKIRIALLGMGVLGGGPLAQGVPVLDETVKRMASDFHIVFYSFIKTQPVEYLQTRQPTQWPLPGRIKYLSVVLQIIWDHLFNPYDIIVGVSAHPTGKAAVQLGRILKRPVIIHLISLEAVSLPDIGYGNFTRPWLAKITSYVCENANVTTVLSNFQNSVAKECFKREMNFKVLPLRIDSKKFLFRVHTITYPVNFLHIGYYHPIKDQNTLFKIFSNIASEVDCTLTIVGDGFEVPVVKSLLTQLSILDKVTFKGLRKQSDLIEFFNDSHILLHTSRYEAECAVTQEAMASGVVVCGTRVGLVADLGDQYAVLAEPQDVETLSAQIIQLIKNPEKYNQIQRDAYSFITQHDVEWSSLKYKKLINEVYSDWHKPVLTHPLQEGR